MSGTFTLAQYERLSAAIARGVTEVSSPDGTRVKYDSLEAMMRLRSAMAAELSAAGDLPLPPSALPATTWATWERR